MRNWYESLISLRRRKTGKDLGMPSFIPFDGLNLTSWMDLKAVNGLKNSGKMKSKTSFAFVIFGFLLKIV